MKKVEIIKVPSTPAYARDAGKIFRITEKPALVSEKWAWRLFLAFKGTTAQVPPEVQALGMVGIAWRGLNSFLAATVEWDKVEPLLDELLADGIEIVRDPSKPSVFTDMHPLEDIEEVATLPWLRSEVIRVHTGFSLAENLWTLVSAMTGPASPTTPTSPP